MERSHVDYVFPATVEEASRLAFDHGDHACLIAGGTDLVLAINQKKRSPGLLIDLSYVSSLRKIEIAYGRIAIGAMVTYSEILADSALCASVPFLSTAVHTIGNAQVRNVATLVGNIVNASPAGDTLAPLYALDSEVRIFGQGGPRELPLRRFIVGPGQTSLAKGDLVTHVVFATPGSGWHCTFEKVGLRHAMAIAVASAALMLRVQERETVDARIALGAVAPTVVRVPEAESYLTGRILTDEAIEHAAQMAKRSAVPIDDVRASAWYRTQVVEGLVRRGLGKLLHQMNKGS